MYITVQKYNRQRIQDIDPKPFLIFTCKKSVGVSSGVSGYLAKQSLCPLNITLSDKHK